jgi:hypothetical protein
MKRWLGPGGALVLAIATLFATHALVLPGLVGLLNDDGFYALAGRTLAAGHGYVDWTTPGHPANARYPIGFPALVALLLAGAANLDAELARIAWIGPLGAATYVFACTLYLLRSWPRAPWAALAGGMLIACHPVVLYNGSLLMSDLFTAAVVVFALLTLEPREGGWRPLVGGLLCGVALVMRYATLPLAIATLLVLRRRSPELRDFLLGLVVAPGAWLVLRLQLGGGESYLGELLAGFTPDQALDALKMLSTTVIPGLLLPWAFRADNAPTLALGLAIMAGLGWAGWRWWRAPSDTERPVAPLYLAGTLVLLVVWQLGFAESGDTLMTRLALPLAPILLALAGRGLSALPAQLATGLLAVGLMGNAWIGMSTWQFHHGLAAKVAEDHGHRDLFEAVGKLVPPEAVLIGWNGAMDTFYTNRPSYRLDEHWPPEVLHDVLQRHAIDYVLVTPQQGDVRAARLALRREAAVPREDLTAKLLGAYARAYPMAVKQVWRNSRGDFAIWQIVR